MTECFFGIMLTDDEFKKYNNRFIDDDYFLYDLDMLDCELSQDFKCYIGIKLLDNKNSLNYILYYYLRLKEELFEFCNYYQIEYRHPKFISYIKRN
jgi:hypothetical protein